MAAFLALAAAAGAGRRPEPAVAQQVVDRPDQVLDVDDQDRPAVVQDRGAVDVGRLAEPRVERPDLEVALAEERVDDHPEPVAPVAHHDHRHRVLRPARLGEAQDLDRVDQPDELVVEQEVGPPLEPADLVAGDPDDPVDPVQREGVGLAGDPDQEGPDHRHRDRQLEREPRPLARPWRRPGPPRRPT